MLGTQASVNEIHWFFKLNISNSMPNVSICHFLLYWNINWNLSSLIKWFKKFKSNFNHIFSFFTALKMLGLLKLLEKEFFWKKFNSTCETIQSQTSLGCATTCL